MIRKEKLSENVRPNIKELVKFKESGNISEIVYVEKLNRTAHIKKLSATEYVHLGTGEVKEFQHRQETRADNIQSVSHSLEKLRDLINTNVVNVRNCRWVTLTYAENMTDTKRLYEDFKKFNMRLRYTLGHYEYIVAMEPQGRGAWHAHMVMIFDKQAPYIENKLMADVWGHGFVTVKRLDDVDNVGAYLTAYLGDMELDEAINSGAILLTCRKEDINDTNLKLVEYKDENGENKTKRYVKGARLKMYPVGFNLYRSSRGIKKPVISYITNKQAEKKVSAHTLTYEKTISISDSENNFSSFINYRYYNSKRK